MSVSPPAASAVPDSTGHFGAYGGVFVPETLVFALRQLEDEYARARKDLGTLGDAL